MQQKITRAKPRVCFFCEEKNDPDYKDVSSLSRFISERGKVVPRMRTFVCLRHQKRLAMAIKRARYLALLPYVVTRI